MDMRADRKIHSVAVLLATSLVTAAAYGQTLPQPAASPTAIIRQVEVGGESGAPIVRVSGEGALTVHAEQLTGPDRLVLDFADARLSGVRSTIAGAPEPIRGIRTG